MKNPYILLFVFALYNQCNAQIHNSNYLDSLNNTRNKPLWVVHFPDSSIVSTYNIIYLHENIEKETVQRLVDQRKLHPLAFAIIDVYPKSNIKFLNLRELCLKFKIPLKKMDLPISVFDIDEMILVPYEEMILDPKDIIVDSSIIKSVKIEHNKDIDKDVIQIIIIKDTEEIRVHRERKEHPNKVWIR